MGRHEGPEVVESHFGILTMRTIHVQHAEDAGMLTAMSTWPPSIVRSWSARATTTGADAAVGVIEPEACAALQAFDARAEHFELALCAEP
jgi:hypothetical protein